MRHEFPLDRQTGEMRVPCALPVGIEVTAVPIATGVHYVMERSSRIEREATEAWPGVQAAGSQDPLLAIDEQHDLRDRKKHIAGCASPLTRPPLVSSTDLRRRIRLSALHPRADGTIDRDRWQIITIAHGSLAL